MYGITPLDLHTSKYHKEIERLKELLQASAVPPSSAVSRLLEEKLRLQEVSVIHDSF